MRTGLQWLMVIALCVRAFLPAGVMIVPSGQDGDGISVVICTDHGPMTVALDADGQPLPKQKKTQKTETCPQVAVSLGAEHSSLAQAVAYGTVDYLLDEVRITGARQLGIRSARGPPLRLT